jgi:hypothetical protein
MAKTTRANHHRKQQYPIVNVQQQQQQTDTDKKHGCDNNNKDDHDNDNDEEEKEERTDAKRKKKKPKRRTIITESNVRQNDVLFGRGSLYNVHNKDTVWRSFVDHPHFKTEYQYHSHKDRYTKQVIGLVRATNSKPPTR